MQRRTRRSEWTSLLRALAILKRLMEGPATKEQLIQSVLDIVGRDAYPSAIGTRQYAFKHDRGNLKKRLGVDYVYDDAAQLYILNDGGPFGRVSLSPTMLRALSILSRQYDNAVGEMAGVRDLVQQIIGWLPPETRLQLENASEELTLDFEQDVDRSVIPPRVWDFANRALNQHRKLTFNYLSPRHADRKPVFHELAPHQIRFQDGHLYLRGYSLNSGLQGESSFLRFRLSYILDDERLYVSPTRVETRHRRPPRFPVQYWLAPEIGRGEISYRFPETQIKRNADGSAEMRAAYARRRDLVLRIARELESEKVLVTPPQGAFYFFLDFRPLMMTSLEICERILEEAGVGLVPGSAFGEQGEGFVRMTIAASDEDVEEGFRKIVEWAERQ